MRAIALCLFSLTQIAPAMALDIEKEIAKVEARELSRSLCRAGERLVFNCRSGQNIASVCLKPGIASEAPTLQYRQGKSGKLEFAIPSSADMSAHVGYKNVQGASDYATYLRFKSGTKSYYAYEASARGPNSPTVGSTRIEPFGVVVLNGGIRTGSLRCKAGYIANMNEQVLGDTVTKLEESEDVDPYEIAFPQKP